MALLMDKHTSSSPPSIASPIEKESKQEFNGAVTDLTSPSALSSSLLFVGGNVPSNKKSPPAQPIISQIPTSQLKEENLFASDFPEYLSFPLPTKENPLNPQGMSKTVKYDRPDLPVNKEPSIQTRKQYPPGFKFMESFPPEKVTDFKHVIYNLLVENHNRLGESTFVQPCIIEEGGIRRTGFYFNEKENPAKKIPELYARHIRKSRLDLEDPSSVFIQDIYKYYLRACVELLSKYFEKLDKYTYLDDDIPLFVPNGSLEDAESRIKQMKTRARKKKRKKTA